MLVHYDQNFPLLLVTDVSPAGLKAVISRRTKEGSERSLTQTERIYSQLDTEATEIIIWGLKLFFLHCFGSKVTLTTDNQPLTRKLHPKKDLPSTSATTLLHYTCSFYG